MQRKFLSAVTRGLKAVDSGDGEIEGYGSIFGVEDHYGDVVEAGAFRISLEAAKKRGRLPAMLWQHDTEEPIGIWTEMEEDAIGLKVRGRLITSISHGQKAYELLKAGAISGLSIGYQTVVSEYDSNTNIRYLKEIDLWELSVVTFPVCDPARITAVKGSDRIKTIRDYEHFLRDAGGYSADHAKRLAAGGFKALAPRDEVAEADIAALTQRLEKLRSI